MRAIPRCFAEELVRYLSVTTPNVATTDCVTFAIVAMGQRRYRPAICVLVKLLDFHLLPPPAEDMLFETSGPRYEIEFDFANRTEECRRSIYVSER
jgi:hypothetical protein